jgi:acyl-CoA dehydrogenase
MEFFFDPEHFALQDRVRRWVNDNLLSSEELETDTDSEARKLVSQLGSEGFLSYVTPRDFGGVRDNVHARDLCILREELARGSSLADAMFAMQACPLPSSRCHG